MRAVPLNKLVLFTASALLVSACTDTKTVFVDRPFFDDPPAAASGYVGYGTEDAQVEHFTVCGNCHIGSQSGWETTAHSDAWATLQASDHARESCEACHSVSENGNAAEGVVGWPATADMRYVDVQCESCHGPGSGHISNPEASQPFASIAVGTDLTSGCGECHQGSHHGFVNEWELSRHGFAGSEHPREEAACQGCHEGRGALIALGVNADYIEKNGGGEPLGIVCAVCHDPHGGAGNAHQLRFPIDVADLDQNLCMKCHQRRAIPDEERASRGPHSPQGPLLLGQDVGWIPPNFDTNIVRGTHGSAQNPELCATCHVHAFEVRDAITDGFVLSVKGHLFRPIPCLDATGVPTEVDTCAVTERSFESCTASGCHADEIAARTVYLSAKAAIANLSAQLQAQLDGVPASAFDNDDGVLTVAEGALFNRKLADIRSSPIHNRFLTEALLLGSMDAVESEYGVAASVSPVWRQARMAEITNR